MEIPFGTFSSSISLRYDKFFLFFCLVLLCVGPASEAQVRQVSQIEIPLSTWENASQYSVLSIGEQGLLLIRRVSGNSEDELLINRLDTLFNSGWESRTLIPKVASLVQEQVHGNISYVLLRNRTEFLLISTNISDGTSVLTALKNPLLFNATEFSVTDDAILIGGYFNQRPLVFYYNFKQDKSKILPGFFDEIGELNQLKTYEDGTIQAIVASKNTAQRKSLWIRTYDTEGNLLRTTILQPDPDKNLIFGKSYQMENGNEVVLGSYGRYTDYARGIFSAEINSDGESKITYHNFGELQRFFSYMSPKHEKRVVERVEKRKLKGKKLRYNYHYLIHEVVPYRNEFILLGEVFYPHYTYASSGRNFSSSYYGNALSRSELVFDGYQYTHAVVAGFDKNGQLLWDNSFKMDNVKTMRLEQFVKIQPFEDKLEMLYLNENNLTSKTILEADVIQNKVTRSLYATNPKNVLTEFNKLDNWYTGHLFAYGALTIVNPVSPNGTRTTRRVFYISKIVCE
jgi:hypothetical protein